MSNEIIQSAVLGLAQGLGEFLPISSSAHLVVFPWLFGFSDPGLAFDVALHFGTLLAVAAYFWKDWIKIFHLAFSGKPFPASSGVSFKKQNDDFKKNFLWLIVVATVPGILAGYFLEKQAETIFRQPLLVASALALAGLVLFLVDRFASREKGMEKTGLKESIAIGLSQALAIIPGVSRSGATITAARALGINRRDAARFSFLLATPVIFGAAVLKFPELWKSGLNFPVILGIFVSASSGYLAIKYLIKFVEKSGYAIFFWYRLALAGIIAAVYFLNQ